MFDTSKDILYIVLAVVVAFVGFFMVWSLFYVTMMLKRAHEVTKQVEELINSVRDRIHQVESLLTKIEDKVNSSASYLPLVFKAVTELVQHFQNRRKKSNAKKGS